MRGLIDGNTDEAPETPYAMIHVDNVVADLKLLQLLQRQRHLAGTGTIAAEAVLMEAVENLMVGEQAYLQGIVSKSRMERLGNRDEADDLCSGSPHRRGSGSLLLENSFQTFCLLLGIG